MHQRRKLNQETISLASLSSGEGGHDSDQGVGEGGSMMDERTRLVPGGRSR